MPKKRKQSVSYIDVQYKLYCEALSLYITLITTGASKRAVDAAQKRFERRHIEFLYSAQPKERVTNDR